MRTIVALASLALTTSCAADRASELSAALERAELSLSEAVQVAQVENAGAGIQADLLTGQATPVFAVGATNTEQSADELRIDGVTGALLARSVLDGFIEPCPEMVPLPDAIATAESAIGGASYQIAPDDDGNCNRQIKVVRDFALFAAKLAPDGTVLELEEDDDGD